MKESIFDAYSQYYDLLYHDKNYKKERDYIHNLLTRFGLTKGNILEFGSGTGKHGSLLAELGYIVHVIELSDEMIAKVKPFPGFTCQQGDITSTNMNQTYDTILSLFHVMNYQIKNKQLQNVFVNAGKHLNSGGLFIFDFWYSPAVYSQKPLIRVKRATNKKIEVTRIAEPEIYPNENRVDVNYNIFVKDLATKSINTFKEVHKVRHFNLPEIDILCDIYGFKRINAEEFVSGANLSEETWSACVALKKI